MIKIDKTSIIDPNAEIADNVVIGPYCIIEKNVKIGEGTIIKPYVNIKSNTTIGKNNTIYQNSVLGENPQDLKFKGEETFLIIGDNNIIRECCTLNRGTDYAYKTIIGNDCLLMAYAHVAHDCIVKDKVILANGVQLGGHVEVGYHATVGGMSPVHQFCKIGEHAFIGGRRLVLQDVPPYILATGEPVQYSGINSIGLRRRNFDSDQRSLIKKAYKFIYRSKLNTTDAISSIKENLEQTKEINNIVKFVENSERGII
tara:strand:+ start:1569 stop:2339 length:771 start_codon:yes stop_codon:yes gene_type:complete